MNMVRLPVTWNLVSIVIVCVAMTACSSTRYVWKNSDSNKSNEAELRKDAGACTLLANQSVPALPPQGQSITQNVTVNTNLYGYNRYGLQGSNDMMKQMREQDFQREQQKNAQRQLKATKNEIASACMASKGWYRVKVQQSSAKVQQGSGYEGCTGSWSEIKKCSERNM